MQHLLTNCKPEKNRRAPNREGRRQSTKIIAFGYKHFKMDHIH